MAGNTYLSGACTIEEISSGRPDYHRRPPRSTAGICRLGAERAGRSRRQRVFELAGLRARLWWAGTHAACLGYAVYHFFNNGWPGWRMSCGSPAVSALAHRHDRR